MIYYTITEGRQGSKCSGTDPVFSYEYTLTDHLGNGRVYFDINAGAARKIKEQEYFAFGMAIQKSLSGMENKYQYNGKEKQGELKVYNYSLFSLYRELTAFGYSARFGACPEASGIR